MYASAVRIQSHWEVPSRSRAFLPHPPTPLSAYSRFVDALRESGEGGGGLRRQGAASPPLASLDNLPSPGGSSSPSEREQLPGEGAGVGAMEDAPSAKRRLAGRAGISSLALRIRP